MRRQRSFNNLSFRQRIHFSIITLILVSVILTGVLLYWIAAGVIERNAFKQSQDMTNKSAQVLDEKLQHTVVAGLSILFSDTYDAMMKDVSLGIADRYYTHLTSLQNVFSQVKLIEPLIDTIMISTPIGDFYPTTYYRRSENTIINSPWLSEVLSDNKVWTARHQDELFDNSSEVVSYMVESSSQYPAKDTYMIINLPIRALSELLSSKLEQKSDMLLLTKEGQIILELNKYNRVTIPKAKLLERVGNGKKGYFDYQNAGEHYLVNYSFVLDGKWVLFNIQSRAVLLEQMNNFKWLAAAMILGCLLAALLVSNVLTTFLLKPLAKLQALMTKVELNDLTVRYESSYHDEITQVGYKFNSMLQQINTLIEEVTDAEQKKRIAEIQLLQSQINPHFLYNTLNSILWKCEMNETDDACEMIVSLSQMLQLGLNRGIDVTTLEMEMKHVRQYLSLLKKCYQGLFEFSIQVEDDSLLKLPILKLVLQPLVENSILHGFKNMNRGGVIRIAVRKENNILHIRAEDNGQGLDAAALMRNITAEDSSAKGYALRNVLHRLRLYYGEKSAIDITSTPHSQTAVVLLIPIEGGGTT